MMFFLEDSPNNAPRYTLRYLHPVFGLFGAKDQGNVFDDWDPYSLFLASVWSSTILHLIQIDPRGADRELN